MDTNQNRLNLFISIDTIKTFMDKHADNQEPELQKLFADCAYTVDITDAAQRLFYRASPDQIELELDWRGLIYQAEESETHRQAVLTLDQQGNVQGNAPDELQDVMQIFLFFCLNMSLWLSEHGVFEKYTDLNPKQQGILVEEQGNELVLNPVSGDERPDLVCRTLSGEMKLMRPYEADMMREVLLDAMPIEKKEAAAEGGDVRMMKHLFQYYMGDYTSAHKDLERNARAMMKLMRAASGEGEEIHEEEEEDTRNPEKAFYWLKKLAESGDAGAMNTLGDFYMKAFGTERDFERAAEWKAKAVENGAEEEDSLGQVLLSAAEMKAKAEAGDTEGQANYARILALFAQYRTDLGDKADEEEAFRWAQKSASKSDPDGIFTLASFYENGTGTAKDATKAFRLFERAANKRHVPSQARLGQMYFQGEGTAENPQAAYEWSRKAAEAGDANGMSNLAACYLLGKGVEQNPGKAVEWLQKAAALGDEGAKGLLEKLGVPLKPQREEEPQPQTVEEAEKMAQQGSVKAMKLLAHYYAHRPGGREDLVVAQKWAQKAADQGDTEIQSLLNELNANLSGKMASFEDVRTAAESGDPFAEQLLGTYYAVGHETEISLSKALYWNRKAAAGGIVDAQEFVDYFDGIGELEQKAKQGDAQAEADLAGKYIAAGRKYENASEKLFAEALKLAECSAGKGNPHGGFMLGLCNENGYGMEPNPEEAFRLYKQSAESGDPDGQCELSHAYMYGIGTEHNQSEAFHWAKSSADLGNGRALMNLATFYELGVGGVSADYEEAVRLLQKAVEKGVPDAERELANLTSPDGMLMIGKTILGLRPEFGEPDREQAAKLMERAAEGGNAEAQYLMGMLCLNGIGVEQDHEKAVEWFRKGAEGGNEDAINNLAQYDRPEAYNLAANMEFAKKENADKEKVFRLMKHAAEGGLATAQSALGLLYIRGYGVWPDYEAGMEWFRKAADQGDENGDKALMQYDKAEGWSRAASMELQAKDRMPDREKAYRMMKRAAEAGLASAQNNLGLFYMSGIGVEPDYEAGMEWFRKAADQGYDSAAKNIQMYQSADGLFLAAAGHSAYAQKTETACPAGYKLLTRAIAAGSAEAVNMQGVMYGGVVKITESFGQTIEKDYERARACFEKALEIKPDLEMAKNNLKKLEDVEEAERVGRETDATLKWIVMQKRPSQNTAGQA